MADGKITIETLVDQSGLVQGLSQIEKTLESFKNSQKDLIISAGIDSSSITGELKSLNSSYNNLTTSVNKNSTSLRNNEASLSSTSKISRRVTYQINSLTKAFQNFISGVVVSKAFEIVTEGFKKATSEIYNLEKGLNKVSILLGDASPNMDELSRSIRSIAVNTAYSTEELTEGLYSALSSGIQATDDMKDSIDFLNQVAKTARGGFADLNETIKSVASILNAYNLGIEETARVTGVLTKTQDYGIITVAELSQYLGQVIPTAAQMGVSIEQVGAAISTLTVQGVSASSAVTGLNQLFRELDKSSLTGAKNLKLAAQAAGYGNTTFREFLSQGWSVADVLELMSQYAKDSGQSLNDLFRNAQSARAAIALTGDQAQKFNRYLNNLSDTSGVVNRNFEKSLHTFQEFGSTMAQFLASVGRRLIPWDFLKNLASGLTEGAQKFLGLKNYAEDLSTSMDSLTSATNSYVDAQSRGVTSTQNLTASMEEQAAVARNVALRDLAYSAKDVYKQIDKLEKSISQDNKTIGTYRASISVLARDMGRTVDEIAALYREGSLGDFVSDKYSSAIKNIADLNAKISSSTLKIEEYNSTLADMYLTISKGIYEGKESFADFVGFGEDFRRELVKISDAYSKGAQAAISFIDSGKSLEVIRSQIRSVEVSLKSAEYGTERYAELQGKLDLLTESFKALGGTLESVSTRSSEVDQILKQLAEDLDEVDIMASYLGDTYNSNSQKLSLYNKAFKDLLTAGAEDNTLFNIAEQIKNLSRSADNSKDPLNDLYKSLSNFRILNTLLGDSFDYNSQAISAYTQTIAELVSEGYEQTHPTIVKLSNELKLLSRDTKDSIQKDLLAISNKVRVYGDSYDATSDYIAAYRANIERLSQNYIANADAIDYNISKLEEYIEKQKDAERQVNKVENAISISSDALSSFFEDIGSGENFWNAFAKSGLNAIASILDALAAQLAALAVSAIPNWASVAKYSAGSVAAAAGAGLVRGWAGNFATGGVVQGPYTGYDNMTAAVQAGETILNRAQAINTARLLDNAYGKNSLGSEGNTIQIQFNGDVYGDKDAISELVYSRIKILQREGRLSKW